MDERVKVTLGSLALLLALGLLAVGCSDTTNDCPQGNQTCEADTGSDAQSDDATGSDCCPATSPAQGDSCQGSCSNCEYGYDPRECGGETLSCTDGTWTRVAHSDPTPACYGDSGTPDAGDTGPGDTDMDDSGPEDSGPDDTTPGDVDALKCEADGGQMCELSCGGLTCDGATEACHVQPPGVDTGTGNNYFCRDFPDACTPNPTCRCLMAYYEGGIRGCDSGPNGITLQRYGA